MIVDANNILRFNIQLVKFLYYFSNGKYIDALNVLHDNKSKIKVLSKYKISEISFICMESICLYSLSYNDSFFDCIDEILNSDDSEFVDLTDPDQGELVCFVLLLAVYIKTIIININDMNMLSDEVKDYCNKIKTKYNLIPNKNEFKSAKLLEDVLINMLKKVNKQKMTSDIECINSIINTYVCNLHSLLYKYTFNG